MSGPFGSSQWMYASGAEEGQSLRFEDGDSAYLSWTPASAGNQKTWTWSGWFKTTTNATDNTFIDAYVDANNECVFRTNSNQLSFIMWDSGAYKVVATTAAVFRDPSAWYHIVLAVDTTQATNSDGVKIWVNGVQQTLSFYTYTQNNDGRVNAAVTHRIGLSAISGSNRYTDGYLANVCFIDGTALDPTSFGEYSDTLWRPKSDADITGNLTFGTNGFYLPFKQTTEAEGFSTVTYTGTSAEHHVEGVGFEPDFVWIKSRTSAESHWLYDSVRGVDEGLKSNATSAENSNLGGLEAFESSGFELGTYDGVNDDGFNYVAWCWDAGSGSAVSNTDGSITSTVKANTAKGFSIVTYSGSGTRTVGHGLGATPKLIIEKKRDATGDWLVQTTVIDGSNDYLRLNTTAAKADGVGASPTSTVFTPNVGGGANCVAYCFAEVSGYSSIGSFSGTGAAGNSITGLGFKPAWIMIKKTNAAEDWAIYDNTRSPVNTVNKLLTANTSDAEATPSANVLDFDSDGFTIQGSGNTINTSGGTYIYMAFADTRDATFFGDTSGNSNNWTPNALNNTDVVPDSPVTGGNFATFNTTVPTAGGTLSEGNLKFNGVSTWGGSKSTIGVPSSGKWYAEARVMTASSNTYQFSFGIKPYTTLSGYTLTKDYAWFFNNGFFILTNGAFSTNGGFTTPAGTIVQVAIDADNGKVWLGYNNSWYDTYNTTNGDPSAGTNETFSGLDFEADDFAIHTDCSYNACFANFGQDSSFAGNETPQGNTDDNGVGDFYYAPPSGYLALTTGNLPDATITAPDEYFNTVLYTGTGSSQSITGVNFQPDWIWWKGRNASSSHLLMNAVVGNTKYLYSNSTAAEQTDGTNVLTSFDSDGFTLPADTGGYANFSGRTYVAWNWLANGTGVSNTDGSITSTVSANQTAGFSVVGWASQSGTYTVGHGLNSAPELIIAKSRTTTGSNWYTFTTVIDGSLDYLSLNSTGAAASDTFSTASPTSTTFGIGSDYVYTSGDNIAYCFHSVDGYSKIGSYTGNGSTDGTFVHCGFRPAWIMVKRTDAVSDWWIWDVERNTYNVASSVLYPNLSATEYTSTSVFPIDLVSNGFKHRGNNTTVNGSGATYIFLAFAEAPFKSANAR